MLKTMPSIQTRADVIGATENRPIHPCEARHSGKTSATARQITNRTTSAAESPHARAMTSSGLFAVARVFILSSIDSQDAAAISNVSANHRFIECAQKMRRLAGGGHPINESPSP